MKYYHFRCREKVEEYDEGPNSIRVDFISLNKEFLENIYLTKKFDSNIFEIEEIRILEDEGIGSMMYEIKKSGEHYMCYHLPAICYDPFVESKTKNTVLDTKPPPDKNE